MAISFDQVELAQIVAFGGLQGSVYVLPTDETIFNCYYYAIPSSDEFCHSHMHRGSLGVIAFVIAFIHGFKWRHFPDSFIFQKCLYTTDRVIIENNNEQRRKVRMNMLYKDSTPVCIHITSPIVLEIDWFESTRFQPPEKKLSFTSREVVGHKK